MINALKMMMLNKLYGQSSDQVEKEMIVYGEIGVPFKGKLI